MSPPEASDPSRELRESRQGKRLLVVHHTVSPSTHAMLRACLDGARDPLIKGVEVIDCAALVASAADALRADGYILLGPVNLGYLAGAIKHFFDQAYYPCLESTVGRPYAAVLHADGDATGALGAMASITRGLRWREAAKPVIVKGTPSVDNLAAIRELAAALAAGLVLQSGPTSS